MMMLRMSGMNPWKKTFDELDEIELPGTKCPSVFGRHKHGLRPSNKAE